MRKRFIQRLIVLVTLSASSAVVAAGPNITVPLRFHIVTNLSMQKGTLNMQGWVSPTEIENELIAEVNRIWKPANITFVVEKVLETSAMMLNNKEKLVAGIVNAKCDVQGKSDRKRIKKLNKLINWRHHAATAINIYLVPYLGETSQGNARPRDQRIFVA